MSKKIHSFLKRKLQRAIDDAVTQLRDGDNDGAESSVKEADLVTRVLAHRVDIQRDHVVSRLLIITPIAILLLVAILLYGRCPNNIVNGEVYCQQVTIILSEDWTLEEDLGINSRLLRIEGASKYENNFLSGQLYQAFNNMEQGSIQLMADSADLLRNEFSLKAQDTIAFEIVGPRQLRISITGPGAVGAVRLCGSVHLIAHNGSGVPIDNKQTIDFDGKIRFFRANAMVRPLILYAEIDSSWNLSGIYAAGIGFKNPNARSSIDPQRATFLSTILGGQIELPAVSNKYDLGYRDDVEFRGVSARCDVRCTDSLRVDLAGSAQGVKVVHGGFARNITPSLFSHIYHNWHVEFWIATISFVGTLIWSVRYLARR